MTLHAAKGLEFPVVFIVGAGAGPAAALAGQRDDSELEEERRLLFVGITRAQRELYLSHCRVRSSAASSRRRFPSRFLDGAARGADGTPRPLGRRAAASASRATVRRTAAPAEPSRGRGPARASSA